MILFKRNHSISSHNGLSVLDGLLETCESSIEVLGKTPGVIPDLLGKMFTRCRMKCCCPRTKSKGKQKQKPHCLDHGGKKVVRE